MAARTGNFFTSLRQSGMGDSEETTRLLQSASGGDQAAAARLMPLVYEALRRLAHRYMDGQTGRGPLAIEPTAVVHEVFLKLVDKETVDFAGQTHFYAVSATALRQVLLDHIRGSRRAKRGGDWRRIAMTDSIAVTNGSDIDLVALDEALARLAQFDQRAARVIELRFFAGMTESQVAAALHVSERTVRNDWSMARAWLHCHLQGAYPDEKH
jgi:RNA polymerase sigma factor (TIGR02999 family)